MKKLLTVTMILLFFVQIGNAQSDLSDKFGKTPSLNTPDSSVDLTGPYFGQTQPGDTPQEFVMPVIVSQLNFLTTRMIFSPDGNECFFSGYNNWNSFNSQMYYTKCVNNVWTEPIAAPFSQSPGYSCTHPFFSIDGNTLYFTKNHDIWKVNRTSQGWGDPQVLSAPVNTAQYEGTYSQTTDGIAYLESLRSGGLGKCDVWRISGQPQQAENLGLPVNSSAGEGGSFISPDGRYLLFNSNLSGGWDNLYVTFSKENGGWTAPINLNQFIPGVNTSNQEYSPKITPDGLYLLYTRINYDTQQGSIYWVSASNINSITNVNFPPYVKNSVPNQTTIKDSLFSYHIPDSTFFDDDGNNTLTYSATLGNGDALPTWLSFDSTATIFSGYPDSIGIFDIKVAATDTAKASASCTFRITIMNTTGIEKNNNRLPKKFILNQNYPNPFNPDTQIEYELSEKTHITLNIYTISGQKIKTLVNDWQVAGIYKAIWDATNDNNKQLSSGLYVYQLECDGYILNKKMFYLK